MFKLSLFFGLCVSVLFFTNCKKQESTTNTSISSEVVQNLAIVSADYTPTSLSTNNSASLNAQSDPCAGVTDFAVCQSNLIREYLKIGKSTVDTLANIASEVGTALGQIPDGNAGTSNDGKISWNKTSDQVWSILVRGTANATTAYLSINGGTYTLKVDKNNAETNPLSQQLEATVNFTDANNWTVDVYFGNDECDALTVKEPSKAQVKLSKSNGLWTGKAMIYVPRWQAPGASAPTCLTMSGASDITMYTDFVGNNTSTKAALYMIPTTESNKSAILDANYSLPQFCTAFSSSCGNGTGQIPVGILNAYPNNWCTTGAGSNPTWGNNCTSNTAVSSASYSSNTEWIAPSDFKTKVITLPTTL